MQFYIVNDMMDFITSVKIACGVIFLATVSEFLLATITRIYVYLPLTASPELNL
jgi:hypothetical protein